MLTIGMEVEVKKVDPIQNKIRGKIGKVVMLTLMDVVVEINGHYNLLPVWAVKPL